MEHFNDIRHFFLCTQQAAGSDEANKKQHRDNNRSDLNRAEWRFLMSFVNHLAKVDAHRHTNQLMNGDDEHIVRFSGKSQPEAEDDDEHKEYPCADQF